MPNTEKALVSLIILLLCLWFGIPSLTDLGFLIIGAFENAFMLVVSNPQAKALAQQTFNNIRWGLVILSLSGLVSILIIILKSLGKNH